MILGMSISTFISLHVVLSVIGLASGCFVLSGMLASRKPAGLTTLFLLTTTATSVTGFLFPFTRLGLGQVAGVLSLAVLLPTLLALYGYRLAGPWRGFFAAGATAALCLNWVIAVAQAFAKIDALQTLAPTQSAPVFVGTQLVVLVIFTGLGILAVRWFHPCATALVRIRLPAAPV
ncbi:MAG: hypothetical protein PSV46_03190 [Reyranella sp.]|nr:hypothetical protein [Reyranella sp.]